MQYISELDFLNIILWKSLIIIRCLIEALIQGTFLDLTYFLKIGTSLSRTSIKKLRFPDLQTIIGIIELFNIFPKDHIQVCQKQPFIQVFKISNFTAFSLPFEGTSFFIHP